MDLPVLYAALAIVLSKYSTQPDMFGDVINANVPQFSEVTGFPQLLYQHLTGWVMQHNVWEDINAVLTFIQSSGGPSAESETYRVYGLLKQLIDNNAFHSIEQVFV